MSAERAHELQYWSQLWDGNQSLWSPLWLLKYLTCAMERALLAAERLSLLRINDREKAVALLTDPIKSAECIKFSGNDATKSVKPLVSLTNEQPWNQRRPLRLHRLSDTHKPSNKPLINPQINCESTAYAEHTRLSCLCYRCCRFISARNIFVPMELAQLHSCSSFIFSFNDQGCHSIEDHSIRLDTSDSV